ELLDNVILCYLRGTLFGILIDVVCDILRRSIIKHLVQRLIFWRIDNMVGSKNIALRCNKGARSRYLQRVASIVLLWKCYLSGRGKTNSEVAFGSGNNTHYRRLCYVSRTHSWISNIASRPTICV